MMTFFHLAVLARPGLALAVESIALVCAPLGAGADRRLLQGGQRSRLKDVVDRRAAGGIDVGEADAGNVDRVARAVEHSVADKLRSLRPGEVGEDLAVRSAERCIFEVGADDDRGGEVDPVDAEGQLDLEILARIDAPVHTEGVEREVSVENLGIARRGSAEGGDVIRLEPPARQRFRRCGLLRPYAVQRSLRDASGRGDRADHRGGPHNDTPAGTPCSARPAPSGRRVFAHCVEPFP